MRIKDGQAGALTEFEISPGMLQAGATALSDAFGASSTGQARAAFLAMLEVALQEGVLQLAE